jgi:Nucleotidyltransferase domain
MYGERTHSARSTAAGTAAVSRVPSGDSGADSRGRVPARRACVRVFGSVARGEAVETSDVDLLVAPGPDTTLFDLSGFALDVEEIVGRHVDVATGRAIPC